MKSKVVYAIYDKVACIYGHIFTLDNLDLNDSESCNADNVAKRQFKFIVANNEVCGKDLELHVLGYIDSKTGVFAMYGLVPGCIMTWQDIANELKDKAEVVND